MASLDEQLELARAAKKKALALYGEWDEVNGVGLTFSNGRYAIKVNLAQELASDRNVKSEIDGVSIVCATVGRLKKQARK